MDYKLYTEKLSALTEEIRDYQRAISVRAYNRALQVCRNQAEISTVTAQYVASDRSFKLLSGDTILDEFACDWYDYRRVANMCDLSDRTYKTALSGSYTPLSLFSYQFPFVNFKAQSNE